MSNVAAPAGLKTYEVRRHNGIVERVSARFIVFPERGADQARLESSSKLIQFLGVDSDGRGALVLALAESEILSIRPVRDDES